MRVLIVAPNGGASLSHGGGVSFVLRQASAYARAGHSVTLAGYHSLSQSELEAIHQIRLPPNVTVSSAAANVPFALNHLLPTKVSPYSALVLPSFRNWIRKLIRNSEDDLIWFHDDIPSAAGDLLKERRIAVYVHFPFDGRRARLVPPITKSRSVTEAVSEEFLRRLRLVHPNPFDLTDTIWTNSSVTSKVIESVWHGRPRGVGPTYSASAYPSSGKKKVLLSVGAISKGKNYLKLIDDFSEVNGKEWTLRIIGHSRDPAELRSLRRRIRLRNLLTRVRVDTNLPRDAVEESYRDSLGYVQSAEFEPLGLSLLEGMAHACYPIARVSEWSGGWVDLLRRGEWGSGFRGGAELSDALRLAEESESGRDAAYERACTFSRAAFEKWALSATA